MSSYWNRVILDEFIHMSMLTEEEEQIIRTRAAGWSQVKQCEELHISLSTLTRRIKKMREQYVSLAPQNEKLPEDLIF